MASPTIRPFTPGDRPAIDPSLDQQGATMRQYYRLQSRIYDATRWSFLFGRNEILHRLPFERRETFHLVEVGCGTGYNLLRLARLYPQARFSGIDVSADMLRKAHRKLSGFEQRVALFEGPYGSDSFRWPNPPDAILFSYALTMINPQYTELIRRAAEDLRPGGIIAVVDFHDSPLPFFKQHMNNHHVRMDSHLPAPLDRHFRPLVKRVKSAYLGSWKYLLYLGKKDGSSSFTPARKNT